MPGITVGNQQFEQVVVKNAEGGETPIHGDTLQCCAPCTAEFKAQAQAMLSDPALLHYAVTADYAARWPDHTPPTLAECEAFVTALTLE